ncbi:hypothetical protein [uncultured Maribacter sp.]|uniref:hypothetical protein n=1 Tax=uncultured Maribacter sp. TaxID=431308 RepID=UPI00262400A0|nr:hypothetical protein [uncultured Maribacter sp.]
MEQYIKHKIRSKNIGTIIGWVLFGIIAAIALVLLLGFGIMWLWNWLMPELFGLTTIGYWQAIGLFALAKVLFGSFGGDSSSKKKKKEKSFANKNENECRDFSKWKQYDQFWKEEGENAYNSFINRTSEEKE